MIFKSILLFTREMNVGHTYISPSLLLSLFLSAWQFGMATDELSYLLHKLYAKYQHVNDVSLSEQPYKSSTIICSVMVEIH